MYGTIIGNILMKQCDRICHKVPLRSLKELDCYARREESHIEGTPKVIVARHLPLGVQELWTDDLRNEPLARLRDLSSNEKAFSYARRLLVSCCKLAHRYGYFIINENMVFFNAKGEIFVWINPDILENKVKIYLPANCEGEAAMTRSLVSYLKLWLRFDSQYLATAQSLDDLLVKFEAVRARALEKLKQREPNKYAHDNRPSINFEETNQHLKALRLRINAKEKAKENRSAQKEPPNKSSEKTTEVTDSPKLFLSFPNKEKRRPRFKPTALTEDKKLRFKTSFGTHMEVQSIKSDSFDPDFEHKTFNNYPSNTSTNNSVNHSLGLKSGSNYFPNRTTSTKPKNHPIVELINSQDTTPDEYRQNKILINGTRESEEGCRKGKESLEGIGEEVNELFLSNIESDGNNTEELKVISAEFEHLLN